MENLLASKLLTVRVGEVEYLSPGVKRIRFEGDLSKTDFSIGYAVSFRVSPVDYRDYTPVVFDRALGICDIIFHIHGKGLGSAFADKLQPGDVTRMVIPRGRKLYRAGSAFHFFFGDESSIGTCYSLMQEGDCAGILELDEVNWEVPGKLKMRADVVDKHHGDMAAALDKYSLNNDVTYVLTGKATSIQAFRKLLRERGVSGSQMIIKAYWVPGKSGA